MIKISRLTKIKLVMYNKKLSNKKIYSINNKPINIFLVINKLL